MDGAYDTRRCHNVIAAQGAAAVIPPRKNAQLWKPTTAGAPSHTFCECVAGRGMARDFNRQVAELQVRITVFNRSTALGIPITEPVG